MFRQGTHPEEMASSELTQIITKQLMIMQILFMVPF
jgi:hypothetical protein